MYVYFGPGQSSISKPCKFHFVISIADWEKLAYFEVISTKLASILPVLRSLDASRAPRSTHTWTDLP
jgi:hypothetical protein